jgi:hypothetical protein
MRATTFNGSFGRAILLLLLPLGLGGTPASADIAPRPGEYERALAREIREAGYDCPAVNRYTRYHGAGAAEMMWGKQAPDLAVCDNGKKYLVAKPPHRFPPLRGLIGPPAPPPTPPAIQVKPM